MILQLLLKDKNGNELPGWSFQFPDADTANAWISEKVASGVWGLPDRWVSLAAGDPQILASNAKRTVVDVPEVPASGNKPAVPAVTHDEYHFDADYTVTLVDVTADGEQGRQIALRRQKQDIGANVIALVAVINDSKNYGLTDFQAMLSDPTLSMIKELLYAGGLGAAKQMILASNDKWFTDADKAALVKLIDDSGLAV